MQYIKGPDFPTGGVILGQARHLRRIPRRAAAGSSFAPRAKSRKCPAIASRIVVTEIPYMVNKAKLIEKIADMVHEKTVEGISDIRDESDRVGMRIVIELKRDTNANVVLNTLYKHTQMQDTFGAIMLALVDGEPKILSLKQMIHHYIEHQEDVIRRRTKYDLDKAEARSHILEGLMVRAGSYRRGDRADSRVPHGAGSARGLDEPLRSDREAGTGDFGYAPAAPDRFGARQDRGGICGFAEADRLFPPGTRGRKDRVRHY